MNYKIIKYINKKYPYYSVKELCITNVLTKR